MSNQHRHWFAIALVFSITLACAVPGLSTQLPVATLDADTLSTAIAGTAAALASQTAQAIPLTNLLPPAAALTVTPTETTASADTATALPTLVFSGFGTALSKQADGSTLFLDQQGKYQFVIPLGWYAFRINELEFYKLWEMPISMTPRIRGTLTSIQGYDPNLFRVFAFDLREGHMQGDTLTNIDTTWNRGMNSFSEFINNMQKSYSRANINSKVLSSQLEKNASNVQVEVVEFELQGETTTGSLTAYEKQLLFKIQSGIVAIRMDTTYDLKDAILPEFDQTKESIKMITP